jgi:hypothetical protein
MAGRNGKSSRPLPTLDNGCYVNSCASTPALTGEIAASEDHLRIAEAMLANQMLGRPMGEDEDEGK